MANGTRCEFIAGAKAGAGEAVLVVPLAVKPQPPLETLATVDAACDGAVSELLKLGAPREDVGALAHTTRSGPVRRILVVSLGETAKLDIQRIRTAAGAAMRGLMGEKIGRAALWLDGLATTPIERAVPAWTSGMALAGFRFSELKNNKKDKAPPERLIVRLVSGAAGRVAAVMPQVREESRIADAVNYARALAHQPANIINPATLAHEARKLARGSRLKCVVLDRPQLRRMGMNGLLSVGDSAANPPCLIRLDYRGAPRSKVTTVIVGKAITFDTGGYSIKPAAGMEAMKFDKCGGMAVLGTMKAAADLKLRCNLVGLVAAAENAISERAYRPADIIRMAGGKTVEIISTDAEGRMVLADALWYAQKELRPSALIDLATLTGGVGVALGKAAAGLMSNNDDLAAELGESGRRTHERLWRLPLWDDYKDLIRGVDSDLRNSSNSRDAHAIVGGMFLKEFVKDDVPWAHLDIAAVATHENGGPAGAKGATGFGVRLLVDYLQRRGASN